MSMLAAASRADTKTRNANPRAFVHEARLSQWRPAAHAIIVGPIKHGIEKA
jgi:hypothetical protein